MGLGYRGVGYQPSIPPNGGAGVGRSRVVWRCSNPTASCRVTRRPHRRPPPLDPLDRLGADERDGDELDDDGRVEPCDGTLGAETEPPLRVLPDEEPLPLLL